MLKMATFIPVNLFLLHYFVFSVYSYSETATLNVSASVVRIGDNVTFECISPQGYTGADYASITFKLLHNNTDLFGNEEAKSIRGDYSINWYTIEISGQQHAGNYTCIITTTGPDKTVSAGAFLKVITDTDKDVGSRGGGKTESSSEDKYALIVLVILPIGALVAAFLIHKEIKRRCQANREGNGQRIKDKEQTKNDGQSNSGEETLKLDKKETNGGDDSIPGQIDDKVNESTQGLLKDEHQENGV
ncbi:uncharacterized protein LOC132758198 [Ruditapes philippinarum]|uniref:uncharacterized protein LOC132758198 n=1 Tax=Ruditapes philippinarum TaxID=129788 RepID=UPI00295ACAA9|nr:uncharacterized protein LOC132758198 [Ruditapes philippinarum]